MHNSLGRYLVITLAKRWWQGSPRIRRYFAETDSGDLECAELLHAGRARCPYGCLGCTMV